MAADPGYCKMFTFLDRTRLVGTISVQGKWKLEEVVSLKMKKKRGLYAPLTDNGKIVVNGILASCFTDIREPIIQNVYFEVSLIPAIQN